MDFAGKDTQPMLRADNVVKRFGAGAVARDREVSALAGVSLEVYSGTTLAVVGPSGSGKSTLGFCLACLERVSSGKVWIAGTEVSGLDERELRAVRPTVQLVFQDPASSLNPRMSARELVMEPLKIQNWRGKEEQSARARELLDRVGIASAKEGRRSGEFSGGQKQRIAIARALALEPKVVILDESLSALDCSVQAKIANLLLELQAYLGLTYVFITHDLAMAAHLGDEIAVMNGGRIVEKGSARGVVDAPAHEVTQRLVNASRSRTAVARSPQLV
jgi:ABC-type glutathione transport system ATPase component